MTPPVAVKKDAARNRTAREYQVTSWKTKYLTGVMRECGYGCWEDVSWDYFVLSTMEEKEKKKKKEILLVASTVHPLLAG